MSHDGFLTQSRPSTPNNLVNTLTFLVNQILGQANIATLVKVVGVHVEGFAAPVGLVDIQLLVQQVDGAGTPIPSATIFDVPYLRLSAGGNAIIMDPTIGDLGFCIFADRDVSLVQASGKPNPPGSKRRFNLADALYIGGWNYGVTPTQFLEFGAGISAETPLFNVSGSVVPGNGASGSLVDATGKIATVQDGIITNIY